MNVPEPKRLAEDDEVSRLMIAEMEGPVLEVPASRRNPRPLVAAAMEDDAIHASEERQRKPGMGWSSVTFQPRGSIARANISASKPLKSRAYRVMNALLRAAEDRGYEVSGKPDTHQRTTYIKVLGRTFDMRLYEPSFQRPHVMNEEERAHKAKYPSALIDKHDYVPSEQLCLQLRPEGAYCVYWQVRDGEKVKVEDRLNKFFIAALRRVDEERTLQRKRDRETAERRNGGTAERHDAERKRKEEEERQRQAEEARKRAQAEVQSLLNEVARWRQSREIREYLADVRRVIAERGQTIRSGSEFDQWIRWAEQAALSMDLLRPQTAQSHDKQH